MYLLQVKNADTASPEYKGTGNLGSENYDLRAHVIAGKPSSVYGSPQRPLVDLLGSGLTTGATTRQTFFHIFLLISVMLPVSLPLAKSRRFNFGCRVAVRRGEITWRWSAERFQPERPRLTAADPRSPTHGSAMRSEYRES